jgi:hypothetical protein
MFTFDYKEFNKVSFYIKSTSSILGKKVIKPTNDGES